MREQQRVRIWPAISRRFSSFQAGWVLLYTAGTVVASPYQPMPKPSPFVVNPAELGVQALVDDRVHRPEQQFLGQDRVAQ